MTAQGLSLPSVETHIHSSLMVPLFLPLCIGERQKSRAVLVVFSLPASEMSPPLAGCLCGVNREPRFLGWLGLLYSGSSGTGSGSLWNG